MTQYNFPPGTLSNGYSTNDLAERKQKRKVILNGVFRRRQIIYQQYFAKLRKYRKSLDITKL